MARLNLESPVERGETIELAATFASNDGTMRLWYRVERSRESDLCSTADPFVIATIHQAMAAGEPLFVDGPVSPSLLRNLEQFQQAWSAWKPKAYRQVEITAASEVEPAAPSRAEAISGFSGGVDSCFTAFRNARGKTTRHPYKLGASVMVQGFDIPLGDDDGFRRAGAKVERQLTSLGVEMYRVATNFQEQPVDWTHAFGAGVASVLALFQGRFRYGLIAQGVPFGAYQSLVEGSNPLTDPLLSSDTFTVVPDGAGFNRTDKIAAIADWKEGIEDLRVCWRNSIRDENCCVCEKCIRNILSFRALGLGRPDCFPLDVSDQQILDLIPIKQIKIDVGFGPILRLAESRGVGDEAWVRTLRKAIDLTHRHRLIRKIKRRIGLRA